MKFFLGYCVIVVIALVIVGGGVLVSPEGESLNTLKFVCPLH